MNREEQLDCLYYYLDKASRKLYTPSYEFAYYRAKFYGTNNVYQA